MRHWFGVVAGGLVVAGLLVAPAQGQVAVQCPPGQFDMLDFLFNDQPDITNQLRRYTSSGEYAGSTQELRAYWPPNGQADSHFYIAKQAPYPHPIAQGRALEFEELTFDAQYIYLLRDTSWQTDQWCRDGSGRAYNTSFELWRRNGTTYRLGGVHFPRCVAPGQTYTFGDQILQPRYEGGSAHPNPYEDDLSTRPPEALRCHTCSAGSPPAWPGNNTRHFRVAGFEASRSFTHTGSDLSAPMTVPVSNVLTIEVMSYPSSAVFERYFYSRDLGWVGYEEPDGPRAYYFGAANGGAPFAIEALDLCPWISIQPAVPVSACASQLVLLHPLPNALPLTALVSSPSNTWSAPSVNATFHGAAVDGRLLLDIATAPRASTAIETLRGELQLDAGSASGLLAPQTFAPAPPMATNFQAVPHPTGTSVTVTWDVTPASGQTIIGHDVYVLDGSLLVFSSTCQSDASVTFNITPGRRYTVQVRSFDATGQASMQASFAYTADVPQCLQGTCLPDVPNLRPTAIQHALVDLYAGHRLVFDSGVQNTGGRASGPFQVSWRVDGAEVAGGTHASVAADTTDPSGNSRLEWLATAGEHVVTFVVDASAMVAELNEADNSRSVVVRVSSDPRPDLTALAFQYRAADLVDGSTVTFDAPVRNLGAGDAPAFALQWRVDGVAVGGLREHPGVDAGTSVTDDAGRLTWPASVGRHLVELTLDTDNALAEANEGNNVRRLVVDVAEASRPDLAPTTLRFNAALVQVGAAVTFDSGVRNLGSADSPAFNVRWLVDGQEVALGSHAPVSAQTTVLDGNSQFTWTVQAGRHTIAFEVDGPGPGRVDESNEGNNRVTAAVGDPTTADIDLVAQVPSFSATQLVADSDLVLSAGVRNTGTEAAAGFLVRWEVDGVEQMRGVYPPVEPATTVTAGAARFVWRARPGRHTVTFDVDSDNTMAETNESNNRRSITFQVPETPLPDLRPTAIRYPPASLAAGVPVLLDSGVANAGLGDAGAFNVRWTVDGAPVGLGSHAGVAAGTTEPNGNSAYTWTPTLGTHVLAFEVDSDQHVRESSETNNRVALTVDVPAQPRPDLCPTAIAFSPAAPRAGESLLFDSAVRNLGTSASGPFQVRWRIDGVPVASGTHDSVPGGTLVTNGNSSLTWTATAGVHTVAFAVDADNAISESNEANNEVVTSLSVTGPLVLGTVGVPSQANVLAAGYAGSGAFGGGALPTAVSLPPGTGRVLTFAVTGTALSCCGAPGRHDADGGTNLQTFISSTSAISGVRHHSRNIFLLGAFLSDDAPAGAAPPALAYHEPADGGSAPTGALSTRAGSYAPLLRQAFFIGEGRGAATEVQRFQVPEGATRLFLGFADGLNLGAPGMGTPSPATPCCYGDNVGALNVTVTLVP